MFNKKKTKESAFLFSSAISIVLLLFFLLIVIIPNTIKDKNVKSEISEDMDKTFKDASIENYTIDEFKIYNDTSSESYTYIAYININSKTESIDEVDTKLSKMHSLGLYYLSIHVENTGTGIILYTNNDRTKVLKFGNAEFMDEDYTLANPIAPNTDQSIFIFGIPCCILLLIYFSVTPDVPAKYPNKHPSYNVQPRCPKCGSTDFQMVARKWSPLTGFFTNKVDRVCTRCKTRY